MSGESENVKFFDKNRDYEDLLIDFKNILKKNSLKFTIQSGRAFNM